MNKPNILFIHLPSIPFDTILKKMSGSDLIPHRLEMPMGILYLSSYLKEYNQPGTVGLLDYSLHIRDIGRYSDVGEFITAVARAEVSFVPDVLAFSLSFSTSNHFFSVSLGILKTIWPQAVTIVGGNHATNAARMLLQTEPVDYVAVGEAEQAFSEFIGRLACNETPRVAGIYSRSDVDGGSQLQLCKMVEELDTIPFPDWGLLDMNAYLTSIGRKRNIGESVNRKSATIMTTRGCPFRCTFCATHTVHGRRMRFRSIANVLEEVRLLHDLYGVTLFIPEDDLFTANRKRVIALLSAFRALDIPDFELQFPNALSVNTLSDDVLDALIDAGMDIACLAIESGCEYVQRHIIEKNCNLNRAKQIVKYLKKKDVIVRCYYVLGFPGETKDQLRETVEYARSTGADWSVFSIATPLVGSKMYRQFVERGYIQDRPDFWFNASYYERQFDTDEISAKELNEFAYRANLEVNFVHNPNITPGNYEKGINIFSDIMAHYPFHIIGWHCLALCYAGLGNTGKYGELMDRIRLLIDSDGRAADMFSKYGDLLPELKKRPVLQG